MVIELPPSLVEHLVDVDPTERSDGDTLVWDETEQTHRYDAGGGVVVAAADPPPDPSHGTLYIDTTAQGINFDGSRS